MVHLVSGLAVAVAVAGDWVVAMPEALLPVLAVAQVAAVEQLSLGAVPVVTAELERARMARIIQVVLERTMEPTMAEPAAEAVILVVAVVVLAIPVAGAVVCRMCGAARRPMAIKTAVAVAQAVRVIPPIQAVVLGSARPMAFMSTGIMVMR
jgi:hypothetical protein